MDQESFTPSDLGQVLRGARQQAGYASVPEFLEALRDRGVPVARTVIYDTESGRRQPTEATIRAYATVLGRPQLLSSVDLQDWKHPEASHDSSWVTGSLISDLTPRHSWLLPTEIDKLETLAKQAPSTKNIFVASSKDDVVGLARSLLARVVCLALDGKIRPGIGSEIYVYQPDSQPGFPGDLATIEWSGVVKAALKVGLDVVHVRAGFDLSGERHGLSWDLRELLGYRGRYLPHALRGDFCLPAPQAIVSMPTVGTIMFLAADDPRRFDTAIYYPWEGEPMVRDAETALWRHTQHCVDAAESIVRRFDALKPWRTLPEDQGPSNADYWWARARSARVFAEIEEQDGIRFLFKDGLSPATCPTDVARERMRRARLAIVDESLRPPFSPPIAEEFLTIRSDRHRAFLAGLRRFEALDFVTKSSLERYVKVGVFNDRLDDFWGSDSTPAEVVEHLQFVVGLLEDEPNYKLIVLDDKHIANLVAPGASLNGAGWMLKANHGESDRAVFEVVREVDDGQGNATFIHTTCEIRQRAAVRSILREFNAMRREYVTDDIRESTIAYLEELVRSIDVTRSKRARKQGVRS